MLTLLSVYHGAAGRVPSGAAPTVDVLERGTLRRAMAVYTTFFVATRSELEGALPDWRRPLASPVKRTRINPLTKQLQVYDSWEPEEVRSERIPAAKPRVVEMRGDYQTYLKERLPVALRTLPQLPTKGVLSPHVEQLLAVVAGRPEERLLPALFPPGGSATGKTLDGLPSWGVDALAAIGRHAILSIGQRLVANEGWFSDEGWPADACATLLQGLNSLAAQARDAKRGIYLLTEA